MRHCFSPGNEMVELYCLWCVDQWKPECPFWLLSFYNKIRCLDHPFHPDNSLEYEGCNGDKLRKDSCPEFLKYTKNLYEKPPGADVGLKGLVITIEISNWLRIALAILRSNYDPEVSLHGMVLSSEHDISTVPLESVFIGYIK